MALTKITFLGTGNAIPSIKRGQSAIYLAAGGKNILLDCGQNTQKRIIEEKCTFFVDAVFISHLHLDHYGGLEGFLKTSHLLGRTKKLIIYTYNKLKLLQKMHNPDFPWLQIISVTPGVEYILGNNILSFDLTHHYEGALSVTVTEKDTVRYDAEKLKTLSELEKKSLFLNKSNGALNLNLKDFIKSTDPHYVVYYSGDSAWDLKNFIRLPNSALIIHECTYFLSEDIANARIQKHTHFKDICNSPCRQKLILTHIAQRACNIYNEIKKLRNVDITLAYDGLSVCGDIAV